MRRWYWCVIIGIVVFGLLGIQRQGTTLALTQSETKTVEIKGEVLHPDVYVVDWNASVADVIEQAGGISEQGTLEGINQTRNMEQGEVLVIPKLPEQTCISINTANLEQLDELPGIGPKIAQRIIDERNLQPFSQLEEIKRVKGIGDKMYEKLKDQICL